MHGNGKLLAWKEEEDEAFGPYTSERKNEAEKGRSLDPGAMQFLIKSIRQELEDVRTYRVV